MKRFVIIVVVSVLIIFAGYGLVKSQKQKLVLNFSEKSNGTIVDVYSIKNEDQPLSDAKKVAGSISKTTTLTLPKGSYRVTSQNNSEFENFDSTFKLADATYKLDINPNYSQTKLDSILASEANQITASLTTKYPTLQSLYAINPGHIFAFGDWYGTTLTAKDQSSFSNDTLRVILQKKSGSWIVVTDPPDIILSKIEYPQIPADVISSVNSL